MGYRDKIIIRLHLVSTSNMKKTGAADLLLF